MGPMLLEALGQPLVLVHGHIPLCVTVIDMTGDGRAL
jgi:hypothetical protein